MNRVRVFTLHRRLALAGVGAFLVLATWGTTTFGQGKGIDTPYLDIVSTPPRDLASRNVSQEDLAKFAWQEFLALSWKSSFAKDGKRGTPDLGWNYKTTGAYPDLLVWQTYAQTTELRPNGPLTIPFDQLGIPQYSYQVPLVAGTPDAKNNLWNNLDEDSEIGSCSLYGQYQKQPATKDLILFQVRVSRDEYEYIRTQFGADQYLPKIGPSGPTGPTGALYQAQQQVIQNIQNAPYSYYPGAPTGPTGTCNCGSAEKAICLPCGGARSPNGGTYEGAIEVKSAWRKLLPSEDPNRYYTATVLYYNNNAQGQLAYYNDVFALIGIHIIHKTQNFPDFVFATFEQVDVEKTDVEYILLDTNGAQTGPAVPVQRQKGQTNRNENHPVPPTLDRVTEQVHTQLKGLNPATIWQYYRLTGVQGQVVDCPVMPPIPQGSAATAGCVQQQDPVTCTNLDPNYFMANFVIESDPFLNNFSGPGFGSNPFKDCHNTVYANKTYNQGGCKGCHGVAQTSFGTDLSFLLDFGNNKPSVAPATLNYNPPALSTAAAKPLKKYLKGSKS